MEGALDMFMFTLPMVGLPQRGSTDLCCVALICKLTLMLSWRQFHFSREKLSYKAGGFMKVCEILSKTGISVNKTVSR